MCFFFYAACNPPAVAFTVRQTSIIEARPSDVRVPFNNISVNIGNGWDPTAKAFIAPVAGVYQFSLSMGSKGAASFELHVISGWYYFLNIQDGSLRYSSGSVTTMVSLNSGDNVFVELNRQGTAACSGAAFCHFSGVLVHQT